MIVSLQSSPVSETFTLSFEVSTCEVQSYYADTPFDIVTDTVRTDLTAYVANEVGESDTLSFTFADFVLSAGSPGCESDFVLTFTLVAPSAYSWLTFDDPMVPSFSVRSVDLNDVGNY